jgi:flagellar biosynthesis protein FlhG
MDQAGTLRELMKDRIALRTHTMKPVRVISVTSGKGGVGKTNVVANIATLLQKAGQKVLVLDGDFGLANLNIVLGLEVKGTLYDVFSGNKSLEEIVLTTKEGVRIIPASSGITKMTQLSTTEKTILMEQLENLHESFDTLLIDTGAGIGADVAYLNSAATEIIVIATPEPTSIADAYALIKVMSSDYKIKKFKLLVNMVDTAKEALGVYNNLLNVADRFLNVHIEYLGHILKDARMAKAVLSRKVLCEAYPDSPATKCLKSLVNQLIEQTTTNPEMSGSLQFFWKKILGEATI